MLAAAYGTVSDIELLFSLSALLGLLYALFNLRDAWGDYSFIRSIGVANGRLTVAKGTVKAESARVIKQSIFLLLGVLATTLPEAPNELHRPWKYIIIGFLFRWGLTLCVALTAYQSYLSWRLRRMLTEGDKKK